MKTEKVIFKMKMIFYQMKVVNLILKYFPKRLKFYFKKKKNLKPGFAEWHVLCENLLQGCYAYFGHTFGDIRTP